MRCLGSGRIVSSRSRWRFRDCIAIRDFTLSGRSTAGRSCSTTPAMASHVETAEQAALVSVLLNRPESIGLLRALTFPGAKRPVTKATLQRIDLAALLRDARDRGMIRDQAMNEVERLTRHTSDVCRTSGVVARTVRRRQWSRDEKVRCRRWPSLRSTSSADRCARHRRSTSSSPTHRTFRGLGRSSTCSTASPTITRSGCAGRASNGMWRAIRSSS